MGPDFGLLQTPDFAGALQKGIQQGRTTAQNSRIQSALASYQDNPDAAEGALVAAGDIQGAQSLGDMRRAKVAADQQQQQLDAQKAALARKQAAGALYATSPQAAVNAAAGAGDTDLAESFQKLDTTQKAAAVQHITLLSGIADQIKGQTGDVNQRVAMAQHLATIHPELGINPQEITPESMSDQAIDDLRASTGKVRAQYDLQPGASRFEEQGPGQPGKLIASVAPKPEVVGPGAVLTDPVTGKTIASAPFAPHVSTVQSADGTSGVAVTTFGQPDGAPATGGALPHAEMVGAGLQSAFPGLVPTSMGRTPEHNAAVGGVPNSGHISDHAVDLVLPKGVTQQQVVAKVQSWGIQPTEVIPEGDHLHISWNPKGGATTGASPTASTKITAQGKPLEVPTQTSDGALTGDLELRAQQRANGDPNWAVGLVRGKAGAAIEQAIGNRASDILKSRGQGAGDVTAGVAQNKANSSALTKTTGNVTAITASEDTLKANFALAQQLAKQNGVGPTGVPWLDTPINKARIANGSVDAKNYDNLLSTTATEYARILTTPTGTGGGSTSDAANREANRLINSGMTLRQLIGAINIAQTEAENRRVANVKVQQGLTNSIRTGNNTTPTQHAGNRPSLSSIFGK